MPFRARDLVGTNTLTVNTYPRGVDFPVEHRDGNSEHLKVDIINLNEELDANFNAMEYGLIWGGAKNTYLPCIQERFIFVYGAKVEVITRVGVYDRAIEEGKKLIVDGAYLGWFAAATIVDGLICLIGTPVVVNTWVELIIEDLSDLILFIPRHDTHLCNVDRLRGDPISLVYNSSTKITRDDICDMPDPDNWQFTIVHDWIHHHDDEHFTYVLHKLYKDLEKESYELYKITDDTGMGYIHVEYL